MENKAKIIDKTRPIVFLDMDGVMNNDKAFAKGLKGVEGVDFPHGLPGYLTVDKECVLRLKRWVEENGADVVMSTSWRDDKMDAHGWERRADNGKFRANHDIWLALTWGGWTDVVERLIGNTPRLYGKSRGDEIDAWLKAHPERYAPGETPVVILDDTTDMTAKQKSACFVRTVEEIGLTDEDVVKMSQIVERKRQKIQQAERHRTPIK
jgi:HAD domain in Swiss Army Knife RNA repair proteins